jgi:hypothetical protein
MLFHSDKTGNLLPCKNKKRAQIYSCIRVQSLGPAFSDVSWMDKDIFVPLGKFYRFVTVLNAIFAEIYNNIHAHLWVSATSSYDKASKYVSVLLTKQQIVVTHRYTLLQETEKT